LNAEAGSEVVGMASNGQHAIEWALKLNPDVIVVDWTMPGMDGLTAARKIKKEKRPQIRIVMFSMHANQALLDQVRSVGLDGVVPKHEDGASLISAIDAVMHGQTYFAA
jgi:DNA-binding NarL/FixJ family response regulator